MNNNQDNLDLLIKISKQPKVSQRILADELGFSLGKLNYCIGALKKKGLIKIKNFKNTQYQKSVVDAITSIDLKENDIILITGSLYLAAEVLNLN